MFQTLRVCAFFARSALSSLSVSIGDLSRLGSGERNLPAAKARSGRATGLKRVIGPQGGKLQILAR